MAVMVIYASVAQARRREPAPARIAQTADR